MHLNGYAAKVGNRRVRIALPVAVGGCQEGEVRAEEIERGDRLSGPSQPDMRSTVAGASAGRVVRDRIVDARSALPSGAITDEPYA
jgi:hypothetical protein